MAPGHPSDLRRIVDGVSLVLLQSLKRTATLQSPRDLETLLSRTVKTALVSATDLAGITSGRLRPYSISPPPPPITTNNEDNNNKDNKASVVFFSHPDTQPEPQILQLQRPSPPPLPLDNNVAASNNALVIDDSINRSLEEQDHRKNVSSTSTPNVATDSAAADHDDDAPRTTTSIPLNKRMRRPREKRVPSTPLSRALGFAGLGAGLAWGTIQESAKRVIYGTPTSTNNQSALSPFLSEQNAERLALALCRMRGAALKLGQMLSIQDESLIPAPILAALDIVRQGADVMPRSQLNDVLDAELGSDWTKKLASFDYEPLASASIGQVHRAVVKDGLVVAMKIQYPGVADSIDSDIENVRRLLNYTNLIPKGLFLDRAIKVAKDELSRECDYELEATNQKRFRELVSTTEGVYVPIVIDEISSRKVLTTELVSGIPIDKVAVLNQETRNYVGRKLLELTLKELFVFRFMQTDPNWSNFLYDETTNMINLIDFGAAREYRKGFVDDYLRMVLACANRDRDAVIEMSKRLGFLTGMESEVMLDAHVQASFIVGLPFSTAGVFDFRSSNITSSISHLGATMLKHRLTPPPDEAYSLHRKLSGAFLACIKLGVVVPCRDLLLQVYQQYRFSDENEDTLSSTA